MTRDFEWRFQRCAPASGDFGIRFTQLGFENTVYLHGPGALGSIERFSVGDDGWVGPMIWTAIGGPDPTAATHGNLVVTVASLDANEFPTGLAAAEAAILPSNGLTVRYFDANNVPDQTLDRTSTAGVAIIGNIPVGEYDIQVNSATHPKCTPLTGGLASPDNSQHARFRIRGATTTVLNLKCAP